MPRTPLGIVLWALSAVTLTFAPTAGAQDATDALPEGEPAEVASRDEEARAHFRLGQAHYEVGHFDEASEEFEQAYALSGRAELLYNVYLAHRDAGHLVEAAEALRGYLDRATGIEGAALLRARLEALDAQIASASVEAPESTEPVEVTQDTAPVTTASSSDDLTPAGWALVAVGGAAVIAGAVLLGVMAADLAAVEGAAPGTPFADVEAAYHRTEPLSIAGFVSLGAGAALAVIGAVLLALPASPGESLALRIGPGALALSGSFR